MTLPPTRPEWSTYRRWASTAVLAGTATLALLCLGFGALTLARGAAGAPGELLDLRAFAPTGEARPIPASQKGTSAETDRLDVRLTVWENTDNRSRPR
jgi:hypothetical protein